MNFEEILDLFLTSRRARGCSNKTLHWYRQMLSVYEDWLQTQSTPLIWHHPTVIEMFLAHERDRGISLSTVEARYRALSAFINWLLERKFLVLETSPMDLVARPVVPERIALHARLADYRKLYSSIPADSWTDWRDRSLVLIFFWSGLRLNEIATLRLPEVDTNALLITVRSGKGGKDRIVPCSPQLPSALLTYLYHRPLWSGEELFLSNNGAGGVRGVITGDGVRQMLKRRCRNAGMTYYHPHAWRHGFAMAFLNAGAEMSSVSAMLGHSSVKITEKVYAHWLTDGLADEYHEARQKLEQKKV